MKKIETYVGVPLFNRTKNKISLIDTGREFVKHANDILKQEKKMINDTLNFHKNHQIISIGYVSLGPILKYKNYFTKNLSTKEITFIEDIEENLIRGLLDNKYDLIFINNNIKTDDITSTFIFEEHLHIAIPNNHALANNKKEVSFSEIDGTTFLISNGNGCWENIVKTNMPNTKFIWQKFENLSDLMNNSTIACFCTNVTLSLYPLENRIAIPIKDDNAKLDFFIAQKKR